jgi:hypothetical protein
MVVLLWKEWHWLAATRVFERSVWRDNAARAPLEDSRRG